MTIEKEPTESINKTSDNKPSVDVNREAVKKEDVIESFDKTEKQERRDKIKEEITARLKDESIWIRLLHIIVLGFAFFIGIWVLLLCVVLQFILRIITGEPNPELLKFGNSLAQYFSAMIRYSLFNSEQAPFPFSEWPK